MNEQNVNGVTYSREVINIPAEYKPISAWGYVGYQLLFSIPCVGFIFLLIYAFGGTSNINLKNFARSYFRVLILLIIVFTIIFGILIALGFSISEISNWR